MRTPGNNSKGGLFSARKPRKGATTRKLRQMNDDRKVVRFAPESPTKLGEPDADEDKNDPSVFFRQYHEQRQAPNLARGPKSHFQPLTDR
jgi:hypothetical protein